MLPDFSLLVSENTRESDDYVNATVWSKAFRKEWRAYRQSHRCNKLAKILAKGLDIRIPDVLETRRGKGSETWVHPVIAIDFAEWLSPEFSIFVKNIFLKYLKGDAELGAELIIRDHNKERVERAKKRVLVATTNKETMELAKDTGTPYAQVHNDRYRGLYQMNAKQLREDGGLDKKETPLDALSEYDLVLNSLVNLRAKMLGNPNAIQQVANTVRKSHKEDFGTDLKPTWEKNRLRPSQARLLAYGQDYQTELPLTS